jgi:predicted nucleic acid-binding protein
MSDPQTPPITRDALNEFIRQLFVCNWVLGELIAGMLERARAAQLDGEEEPMTDDAYPIRR